MDWMEASFSAGFSLYFAWLLPSESIKTDLNWKNNKRKNSKNYIERVLLKEYLKFNVLFVDTIPDGFPHLYENLSDIV